MYAFDTYQDSEAFSNVITSMLRFFSRDVYYLLDQGSTLSYVTPFVAAYFDFGLECMPDPFFIFTPVGDSMVAKRVYRGCVVFVGGKETLVDLIELDMVNFDVILRMDRLYSCYASLYCWTLKVIFKFLNEPIIEWERGSLVPKGRFISYLIDQNLISKGCHYHLVRVKDSSLEDPSLQSVPMVNEFLEFFFMIFLVSLPIGRLILGLTLFWTLVLFPFLFIEWPRLS